MKILIEGETPVTQENFKKLINYINSGKYSEIVYDNSREHQAGVLEGDDFFGILYPALEKNNVTFTVITNGERNFFPHQPEAYPFVKIIRTPFHFFRHTRNQYETMIGNISDYNVDKFETPFIYLNAKPHSYRCMLMDKMQKSSAIHNCKYTWAFTQSDMEWGGYEFKNWKEHNVHLEPNITPTTIIHEHYLDIQLKPFAQLVSESQLDYFFITEKTAKPIFLKQPFLVFGNVGFHSKLKELGFKLYTELFDYGFDIISNDEIRAELIVKEFEKLQSVDIYKMYEILKPKLIYNMNHVNTLCDSYEANKELVDYIKERIEYFKEPLINKNIHSYYLTKIIL